MYFLLVGGFCQMFELKSQLSVVQQSPASVLWGPPVPLWLFLTFSSHHGLGAVSEVFPSQEGNSEYVLFLA